MREKEQKSEMRIFVIGFGKEKDSGKIGKRG